MNSLKKLIADNIKETKELKEVISKDGAEKIRKYDEMTAMIKSMNGCFSAHCMSSVDSNGDPCVIITYKCEIPKQYIKLDDKFNPVVTDVFKSINSLNLVSLKDMAEISKSLSDLKQEKKRIELIINK